MKLVMKEGKKALSLAYSLSNFCCIWRKFLLFGSRHAWRPLSGMCWIKVWEVVTDRIAGSCIVLPVVAQGWRLLLSSWRLLRFSFPGGESPVHCGNKQTRGRMASWEITWMGILKWVSVSSTDTYICTNNFSYSSVSSFAKLVYWLRQPGIHF